MQIIIDLDGTICTEEKTFSRGLAKPLTNAVETISTWYKQGHTIIIYSSRTWMEFEMTTEWLRENKVKYHQLVLGKPIGDIWIDDRAIDFTNWYSIKNKVNEKIMLKKYKKDQ